MMLPVLSDEKQQCAGNGDASLSRRALLKYAAACGVSAFLAGCPSEQREAFFQKRFKELSPDEVERVLARLAKQHSQEFGKSVSVAADPPLAGVLYGYGLDLSRCIGCRRCVY